MRAKTFLISSTVFTEHITYAYYVKKNVLRTKNLNGSYPKKLVHRNSGYEVYQVILKDLGNQHFRILALKGLKAEGTGAWQTKILIFHKRQVTFHMRQVKKILAKYVASQ
jgi:hypothetical protein